MTTVKKPGKLNALLSKWPKGTVAVQKWLDTQGVPRQLADRYCRFCWLNRIARGAYTRLSEEADWMGALYAIQRQLGLPIHIGDKTALEIQGYAHYIPLGKGRYVFLYGPPRIKPPSWFLRHGWDVRPQYISTNLFSRNQDAGLIEYDLGDYSLRISSPERAMLECLDMEPQDQLFKDSKLLMEGLTSLRPEVVQELLELCGSVKAKRLFLYLAEECGHPWVSKLDPSRVDLGRGKRVIVKGGSLDPKYQITVPLKREQEQEST